MSDTNKRALFLSGGSTKFIGLASASIRLWELGYRPDIVGGISAGSVMTLPYVLGYHSELIEMGLNLTPSKIFKSSPLNKKNKITFKAALRVLFGKNSLGIQDLKPLVKSVISKKDFQKYQKEDYPEIYIMAVNPTTGGRTVWNIKDDSICYHDYLQIISASTRIPIMTQAEYINGEAFFDGGLRNHTPSTKILALREDITKFISIYSRPQNFQSKDEFWDQNIFKTLMRTTQIMTFEISKRDEEMENLIAENRGLKHKQLFLPTVLNSMYDMSPELLLKIKQEGIDSVDNNIGDFLD